LALTVALRGSDFFAQLLGSCSSTVLEELLPFLQPPLLKFEALPALIHNATRCLAHNHSLQSEEPARLARTVGDVVAQVLMQAEKSKELNVLAFQKLFMQLLIKGNCDKDRACQIGLLRAGIFKYFKQCDELLEKNQQHGEFGLELVSNLASIAPLVGSIFPTIKTVVTKVVSRKVRNKKNERAKFDMQIKHVYDDDIYSKIALRQGIQTGVLKDGREVVVKIEEVIFKKWYERMLNWNGCKEN